MPDGGHAPTASDILGALPGGVVVLDPVGTILSASPQADELIGRAAGELVGTSVLSLVDEETAWIYAAAVAMATDYTEEIMGPMRISVVTDSGATRALDLWATNHLEDPAIGGIVCLLTPESCASGLATAIGLLAEDRPFVETAQASAEALRGFPVNAAAAVVAVGDDSSTVVASSGVSPEVAAALAGPGPWRLMPGQPRHVPSDLAQLPADLQEVVHSAGHEAVWVEPVAVDGTGGALVVFRSHTGAPSPNELNSVYEAAAIVRLAWERHDREAT
ncbi:MAG: hypothetical protein JJU45_00440 [Acidimicrobiia bacterium]|nr:hypothetical protein [Acidimicrobiia bacterium]